jgi:hypothetical protein
LKSFETSKEAVTSPKDHITGKTTNALQYVPNQANNDITAFDLDASTGTLTRGTLTFPASNGVSYVFHDVVRADPSGSVVFALGAYSSEPGGSETGQSYGFAVDQADGGLTQVPGSPCSVNGQWIGSEGLAVTQ